MRQAPLLVVALVVWAAGSSGQSPAPAASPAAINPALLRAQWPASWIAAPDAPQRDFGVYHFRRLFDLDDPPPRALVHVTADQRYELHVNGQRVGAGPARGDIAHWPFESYDVAPLLRRGRNIVAATVWNFGPDAPMAQMTRRTGFLLQADDKRLAMLDTGTAWEARVARGYQLHRGGLDAIRARRFYYSAAPPERIDGRLLDWSWDALTSPADGWKPAITLSRAHPRDIRDGPAWMQSPEGWLLVPSPMPQMRHSPASAGEIVRHEGTTASSLPLTVPARTRVRLLFMRPDVVNAYPRLVVSGGRDATLRLTYAEALYDAAGGKGVRSEIAGKTIAGLVDEFIADGGPRRAFRPLWFRSWRFLELDVATADAPITIDALDGLATGFPFARVASFESDDAALGRIFDVGWRTAELAGHETYMDAPYWEQLQYVGDTRVDALITYAVTGDDRLPRRAIELFDQSRSYEGLTQSRYPTFEPQYIPPYSLFFVQMVHEFWMYRGDDAFVRARLPGTRAVLDWFIARQRPDGLLGFLPYWVHGDTGTVLDDAIQEADGGSGVIGMQYLETLRMAAELEDAIGDRGRAERYRRCAAETERGLATLWDADRGMFADTPARRSWGHPVNIYALITGVTPTGRERDLLDRVTRIARHPAGRAADGGKGGAWPLEAIPSASYYFRFYLSRALEARGAGDAYVSLLEPWRRMLEMGLTTWPEHPEPTRSDSHAWSAHPTLDLLRIVAGIRPAAPGFARVSIAPALGPLRRVRATHAHPAGAIHVELTRVGDTGLEAVVTLPAGVDGRLTWRGETRPLAAGTQTVRVP